jgi:alkanesulfonate monooxygenase SsuD/methylene tetrahydromethanopterin reductase-like flavin-dependent oxidoreductase (luciferase family)
MQGYFQRFAPSAFYAEPVGLVAVGVVCADTEAEAERMYSSQRLRRLLRDRGEGGGGGPIPTPEEAMARLAELPAAPTGNAREEFPRVVVGNPEQVEEQLTRLAEAFGVDEIMAITVVHDHEARKHSYELLARMFGLPRND